MFYLFLTCISSANIAFDVVNSFKKTKSTLDDTKINSFWKYA